MREIVNAIFHVLGGGGSGWRLLASDMQPHSKAYRWLVIWRDTGLIDTGCYRALMQAMDMTW